MIMVKAPPSIRSMFVVFKVFMLSKVLRNAIRQSVRVGNAWAMPHSLDVVAAVSSVFNYNIHAHSADAVPTDMRSSSAATSGAF